MERLAYDLSVIGLSDEPEEHRANRSRPQISLSTLPTEILMRIIEQCFLDPTRVAEPQWTPEGRHVPRDSRRLLGGSLRDLTLVSRQFRALTAPLLFESICICDNSASTKEDKLRTTHEQLVRLPTYEWLRHMKKLTVSLGRHPNPYPTYAAQDFVQMLNYMQWPSTMRYVLERAVAQYTILNDVRHLLTKWRRSGMVFEIFKVRQLELSCVWGSHCWDFQFLTWPYVSVERLWLDFNTMQLSPGSLLLDRLRNLEYVMHRAHPIGVFNTRAELNNFQGFSAPDGRRPPLLRQLGNTMRHVKHLALYGVLKGPVTMIIPLIRDMHSLEQLDITDQQAVTQEDIHSIREMAHHLPEFDWAIKHSRLIREHADNVDRIEAAIAFFTALTNLQRICFVRDQIGTVYRAERDDETGKLHHVVESGTVRERFRYLRPSIHNSAVWRCGFPNRLGYSLWNHVAAADSWCRADEAFWLEPAPLTGSERGAADASHHLRSDRAHHDSSGISTLQEHENLSRFNARHKERTRKRRKQKRRDAFIRGQWVGRRKN